MKEGKYSPAANLIFRETFESENSMRINKCTPNNLVFIEGVGQFNGTSSYVQCKKILNGTYSIRFRLKSFTSKTVWQYFADFRNSTSTGTGYIAQKITTGVLESSSGTSYINGVASTTLNNSTKEIIVSGISITKCFEIFIGRNASASMNYIESSIELLEIYSGTLTASEVANLYNSSFNIPFLNKNALMLFDATQGGLIDRTKLRTLTVTNVVTRREGNSYSAIFNGIDSKIDTGSDWINTKAVTVCGWVKFNSYGEGGNGRIISNDNLILFGALDSNGTFFITSNNSTYATASSIIGLYRWIFISITRSLTGVVNMYIGRKSSSPIIIGSVNQSSGNPVAGSNIIIGNNTGQTRTMNGSIKMLNVYEGILTINEISAIWAQTRRII